MFDWHKHIALYIRRHRIIACAVGVNLFLTGLVCTVVFASRSELSLPDIDVPSYYRPGNALGDLSSCVSEHDSWTTSMRCTERGAGRIRYYIAYDGVHNRVVRASRWTGDEELRLGDLVLAWGPPISVGGGYVSWGKHNAFALGRWGLSPYDKVYIVSYTLEPLTQDRWQGFRNKLPYSISIDLTSLILFK